MGHVLLVVTAEYKLFFAPTLFYTPFTSPLLKHCNHGLRTPNESINQRYLKNWADVADKICFGRTEKFGSGSEFSAVQ